MESPLKRSFELGWMSMTGCVFTGTLLPVRNQVVDIHSNITSDFTQQGWRNITSPMIGNCRSAAVVMAELHMRPALAHADKPEPPQN
jgi:hypothetical protein